ncbi:hypothetical protein Clacol_010270 [Clathrus columnatus]|uniref:Uncharacterized protein n=1 Tax=Clathrus columnatus TaxID=1419009 RepID=A0AAV5AMW5_9AGAM|nr:hypothetical protein Clacol_010270 [Clathrus columnatus]
MESSITLTHENNTDYGLSFVNSDVNWQSPRWLIAHGRIDEARQILSRLTSKTAKPTDAIVIAQSKEIEDALALERSISGDFSYKELFQNGELQNFRRICLCFGIQLMQQVIEKLGRRRSMMICAAGCSSSMIVLGVLLATGATGSKTRGAAAAAMMFVFNTFFYPAEICTLRIRSKGAATATISNWLFNFVIVQITPVAIQNLQWRTYIMFAVFNAAFIPAVYFFYPETALKPLESIDMIFSSPDKNKIGTGEDLLSRNQGKDFGSEEYFETKEVREEAGKSESVEN